MKEVSLPALRYEKDQSQQLQSQGQGQAVRTVLQRHISSLLSEVELIPSYSLERVSVIARTPSRQTPRTSTPSMSTLEEMEMSLQEEKWMQVFSQHPFFYLLTLVLRAARDAPPA